MRKRSRTALLSGGLCLAGAALAVASVAAAPKTAATAPAGSGAGGPATGPTAVYWVSASTTTGLMAGMSGANGRPSMGAVMGMMMRGGPRADAVTRSLRLQLGSAEKPTGAPTAEHDPPAGLGVGPSLPLVTPVSQPSQPVEEGPAEPEKQYQKPNGRMLIFWGCGEHAGPNQPVVIDFAKVAAGQQSFAAFKGLPVTYARPPSPSRNATYGEWPNERSRVSVPATGSLVGDHLIKGAYTPDIRFSLANNQDFLAPLNLTANAPTPSGAVQLAWTPVPGAMAYGVTVVGGDQGPGGQGAGGQGATVVVWSSSQAQAAAFGLPEYLTPGDTRRLLEGRYLLPPQTSSCQVPMEVVQAAPHAMTFLVAYGQEADFSYPPRPAEPGKAWNLAWTVKVRYRSTTSALLGQSLGGLSATGQPGSQKPQQKQSPTKSILKGLGGFIPGT